MHAKPRWLHALWTIVPKCDLLLKLVLPSSIGTFHARPSGFEFIVLATRGPVQSFSNYILFGYVEPAYYPT